jgi:hypothetical protein
MSFAARVQGALQRRVRRVYYERVKPERPLGELHATLAPGLDVDLLAADGFQRLWAAHLASTPDSLWKVMPPAMPNTIEHAVRGEARVLARTVSVTPATDWHRDPFHGVAWPKVHVESWPYQAPGGDIEVLWHLNRMAYLIDRAAAWRATGDPEMAARVHELMESWARGNPWRVGANWISPMQTGMRLFTWSVSLAGMRDAPLPSPRRCEIILRSVFRQAEFLASHFSRWVVPNNHLIGESALLAAFATYWPVLKSAPVWMQQAESTLIEEARRQVLADGFDFEHSVNYHLVVLDFFLVYLHAKLLRGETPDAFVLKQTHAMADAALALVSPSGRMPMIGDDSMPDFLVLGGRMGTPGPLSESTTFEDFLRVEHARLFTTTSWGRDLLSLRKPAVYARRFHEAGIDVARDRSSHLVFTHGPQHRHVYSHGHLHADAGSFELELSGTPVVIDSGSYLYGSPGVRSHMRSARAHNTAIIDGVEPMIPLAVFEWQSVASSEALGFGVSGDVVVTGCRRQLPGLDGAAVSHTRVLLRAGSTVIVTDAFDPGAPAGRGGHSAALYFHTPIPSGTAVVEGQRVRMTDSARFIRVFEVLDEPRATVEILDAADRASQYSPIYGEIATGTTIRVTVPVEQMTVIVTAFRDPEVAVTRMHARVGQIGCAVEDGHSRRILSLCLDPFAAYVGGRPVTAVSDPAAARPHGESNSLAWLDELDA